MPVATTTMTDRFPRQRYVSLETRKKDGSVVRTPIWFAEAGGFFGFYTRGVSGKVKRLRNFPEVRLAPCTATGKITGEWVSAKAHPVEGAEAGRIFTMLDAKYTWQRRLINLFYLLNQKPRAAYRVDF